MRGARWRRWRTPVRAGSAWYGDPAAQWRQPPVSRALAASTGAAPCSCHAERARRSRWGTALARRHGPRDARGDTLAATPGKHSDCQYAGPWQRPLVHHPARAAFPPCRQFAVSPTAVYRHAIARRSSWLALRSWGVRCSMTKWTSPRRRGPSRRPLHLTGHIADYPWNPSGERSSMRCTTLRLSAAVGRLAAPWPDRATRPRWV
jgi:hypothetical protein